MTAQDRLNLIAEAEPQEIPVLLAALAARMVMLSGSPAPAPTDFAASADDSIDVIEAAKRTGMSVSWLYKNAK